VFDYFGPNPSGSKPGLCGAPVVHEKSLNDELDGILIGFVQWNSGRDCIVAALDELLECGWQLAKV
jgi:hypothetical protein